jgi:dTDP-glucose 4,6-dehydratase
VKILVTGAEGFIGSHLTEALVAEGHDVRAMVLYNYAGSWGWLEQSTVRDNADVFLGDVRDPYGVAQAMSGRELVFHLAALIGIPYSYYAPASYVETNVTGTLNVVQAARDAGAKVVHTSTSEVYGTAQSVPIAEDHPIIGQSPYSASKIGADHIALSYNRAFDLPVAVARPFNTYGPRQSNRAVIPTIISQIAAGERVIKLGTLSPTRDFNYVDDTVQGLLAIAKAEAAVGEIINLGSGFEISIGNTVALIAEIAGVDVEIVSDEKRMRPEASEVERLCAANDKAKDLTGWQPVFGGRDGLTKGLAKTIDWFGDPENLKTYKSQRYGV